MWCDGTNGDFHCTLRDMIIQKRTRGSIVAFLTVNERGDCQAIDGRWEDCAEYKPLAGFNPYDDRDQP